VIASVAVDDPAVPQKGSLIVVPLTAPAGPRPEAEKVAVTGRPSATLAAALTPALASTSVIRASAAKLTSCGAFTASATALETRMPAAAVTWPVAGS
jgi:hypothetical protein